MIEQLWQTIFWEEDNVVVYRMWLCIEWTDIQNIKKLPQIVHFRDSENMESQDHRTQDHRTRDHRITEVEKTLKMIKSNYKPTIATIKPKVPHLHVF